MSETLEHSADPPKGGTGNGGGYAWLLTTKQPTQFGGQGNLDAF